MHREIALFGPWRCNTIKFKSDLLVLVQRTDSGSEIRKAHEARGTQRSGVVGIWVSFC